MSGTGKLTFNDASPFHVHALPNGLTLVAEHMPGVATVAFELHVPAGAAFDPPGQLGAANVLGDLVLRGAGTLNSRELVDRLDTLGLQRGSGAGTLTTRFSAVGLAGNVRAALPIYADVVRRPHLLPGEFEPARELAVQAVQGVADDPQRQMGLALREWFWPVPLGRNTLGEEGDLIRLTPDAVKMVHAMRYAPTGCVISVAGAIDFDEWRGAVEASFGDWTAPPPDDYRTFPPAGQQHYIANDSEQTHIGLAFPEVPEDDDGYYVARLAIECLSGGSSGRLFTEIREKRGLVYSVGAGYAALPGFGGVLGHAGTTADRAAETLSVFRDALARWRRDGVTEEELTRAKTGLLSGTIMSGESTSARAAAIAHDWRTRRRLRPMDEIRRDLEAVTIGQVNRHLAARQDVPETLVTVGPEPLV
jgi:predicted Zn-dependent peptidase